MLNNLYFKNKKDTTQYSKTFESQVLIFLCMKKGTIINWHQYEQSDQTTFTWTKK